MNLDDRVVNLGDRYTVTVHAVSAARFLRIANDSPYRLRVWYDALTADFVFIEPYSELANEQPMGIPHTDVLHMRGWQGLINISVELPLSGNIPAAPPASGVTIDGYAYRSEAVRRGIRSSVGSAVNTVTNPPILSSGSTETGVWGIQIPAGLVAGTVIYTSVNFKTQLTQQPLTTAMTLTIQHDTPGGGYGLGALAIQYINRYGAAIAVTTNGSGQDFLWGQYTVVSP